MPEELVSSALSIQDPATTEDVSHLLFLYAHVGGLLGSFNRKAWQIVHGSLSVGKKRKTKQNEHQLGID